MRTADSFVSTLFAHSQEAPDALALTVGKGESISYAALWQQATALADKLTCCKGSTFVFVLSHRNHMQVVAILAGLIAKVPVAIIDFRQGKSRVANMLQQGQDLIGLVDNAGEKLLQDLFSENKLNNVFSYLSLEAVENDFTFLKQEQEKEQVDSIFDIPQSVALILFTSGSTGHPKGVCITYDDIDSRCATEKEWFNIKKGDCILGVLPLNFDVGLVQLLGSLYSGAHHIMAASWLPADILKSIEKWSATGLAMSPMVWQGLLKTKNQDSLWQTLNRLRYVTLSGGTLDVKTLEHISKNLVNATLVKTYGQTEMFRIASLKVDSEGNHLQSVGPIYPGVQVSIVDEQGKELTAGKQGEIVATGMGAMGGYLSSGGCQKVGTIFTGDLGYFDESGNLIVNGRKNEMIKIFDQRVFPADVANSLQEILNVSPVYVVVSGGEEPHLIAAVESSKVSKSIAEMMLTIRQNLASHIVPKQLLVLDEIPETLSGKIDAVRVRKIAANQ
jgi:acyl-CoA synthetase (AMP-forming)/AMP-acid ligase II